MVYCAYKGFYLQKKIPDMKYRLIGLLLGLFFFTACNNTQPGDQASGSEEQTEVTTSEETESEGDSKPQRVSPPRTATGEIEGINVEINYSSPSVKGRKIWGGLVPYGEVWRTGANEATTISFSKTAKVEGKNLAAGKYALFTIPGEGKWSVIFNTVPNQWGAYEYDASKNALKVEVEPEKTEGEPVEMLEFAVEGNRVVLKWENLSVPISISTAEAG